ncbi:FtsQ-type POTRA domain-containing protein [Candidatus Daviesbacteria bacterium]|nr:FtsQ-type POTRA domain-containing protein [Candidatus Daviesbacteria bacterium]
MKWGLILVGLVLAFGLSVAVFKFNLLLISRVDVKIDQPACASAEAIKFASNLIGKNLFLVNSQDVEGKLIQKYPCVREIVLHRVFPGKVTIEVSLRKELVRIAGLTTRGQLSFSNLEASASTATALLDWSFPKASAEAYLLADKTGFLFGQADSTGSGVLYLDDPMLKIGQSLGTAFVQKIVPILEKINELGESSIVGKKGGDILQIASGQKLVFDLDRDILHQLASLQLILQKAKIDQRSVESIDLRFDKPVVIYSGKNGKR